MKNVLEYPMGPIMAVTHPDPYPYYRELVEQRPFYYDRDLKLWIAASAAAVTEVLTSEFCRVRPLDEPVPRTLIDSPAGTIFGNLVRMNDGEKHEKLKTAVIGSTDKLDFADMTAISDRCAKTLFATMGVAGGFSRISEFSFQLPVHVMANLLGVANKNIPGIAVWIDELVACFAAGAAGAAGVAGAGGAEADRIERGNKAAANLLDLFQGLLGQMSGESKGVLFDLARRYAGGAKYAAAANAIGFMTQAYEATAGLIGNTLVALGNDSSLRSRLAAEPALLPDLIAEVARCDPPVQNTRRFAAADGEIAGQKIKTGDAILVIVAAANHDPARNHHPEKLDIFRSERRSFTFGAGSHACPGQRLAETIACAGVRQILGSGVEMGELAGPFMYRRSVNTRIPVFSNLKG